MSMVAIVGVPISSTIGASINPPAIAAFQWNRRGVPIPGSAGHIYTPVNADIGTNTLTVSVVAFNGFGINFAATSLPITVIPAMTKSDVLNIGQNSTIGSVPTGA
jgi:hypothetical protein